ncbi:hypothetical protein GCM10027073_29080 [Streptomyces chlorus]
MITYSDDGPDFEPDDPLAVILRPASDYLGPPAGRYEEIRRVAARRRRVRAAVGVGVSCAFAAFAALVVLPLQPAAPDKPASPTVPLAPPPVSSPSSAPAPTAIPRPVSPSPSEQARTDVPDAPTPRPTAVPSASPVPASP